MNTRHDKYSAVEISTLVGISRSAVYSRLHRDKLVLPDRSVPVDDIKKLFAPRPRKRPVQRFTCSKCYKPKEMGSGRLRKICKECLPDCRANQRYSHFKLTEPDFLNMLTSQGGKCAICRRGLVRNKTKKAPDFACIDHDHSTGKVRGLLCPGCNMKLGHMENIEWVTKAREYLKLHSV
jgi:hypothetical protein